MKRILYGTIIILVVSVGTFFTYKLFQKSESLVEKQKGSLRIIWAEMKVSDALQELVNDFTNETGIQIEVVQEPWATFQTVFFEEMKKKGESYDMVGGDSQWLGLGATKGYYVELTALIKEFGIDKSMSAIANSLYSEYPIGSGHYWAIPLNGDALSFAYRRDLFEDPIEKRNFEAKYGYPLDIPGTWEQFRDISEFFHRPEDNLFGNSLWSSLDYDGTTMAVETLIWGWGGELGNYQTHEVNNLLNSDKSIKALEFYKQLYKYHSPDYQEVYFESLDAFIKGKVAMAMTYYAVNPTLDDPKLNPHSSVTGYFTSPRGPERKVTALAGQGLSIISYTRKKELCLEFIKWFVREDVQEKWAKLGGLSCNANVMDSEMFMKIAPYNKGFSESMKFVKDFWAVPEYVELLSISQKYWNGYLTSDDLTAKEVMNTIAKEWEMVFDEAGYYKE